MRRRWAGRVAVLMAATLIVRCGDDPTAVDPVAEVSTSWWSGEAPAVPPLLVRDVDAETWAEPLEAWVVPREAVRDALNAGRFDEAARDPSAQPWPASWDAGNWVVARTESGWGAAARVRHLPTMVVTEPRVDHRFVVGFEDGSPAHELRLDVVVRPSSRTADEGVGRVLATLRTDARGEAVMDVRQLRAEWRRTGVVGAQELFVTPRMLADARPCVAIDPHATETRLTVPDFGTFEVIPEGTDEAVLSVEPAARWRPRGGLDAGPARFEFREAPYVVPVAVGCELAFGLHSPADRWPSEYRTHAGPQAAHERVMQRVAVSLKAQAQPTEPSAEGVDVVLQPTTELLRGVVQDDRGKPIRAASVDVAYSSAAVRTTLQTTTAEDGTFVFFADHRLGEPCDVRVEAFGYLAPVDGAFESVAHREATVGDTVTVVLQRAAVFVGQLLLSDGVPPECVSLSADDPRGPRGIVHRLGRGAFLAIVARGPWSLLVEARPAIDQPFDVVRTVEGLWGAAGAWVEDPRLRLDLRDTFDAVEVQCLGADGKPCSDALVRVMHRGRGLGPPASPVNALGRTCLVLRLDAWDLRVGAPGHGLVSRSGEALLQDGVVPLPAGRPVTLTVEGEGLDAVLDEAVERGVTWTPYVEPDVPFFKKQGNLSLMRAILAASEAEKVPSPDGDRPSSRLFFPADGPYHVRWVLTQPARGRQRVVDGAARVNIDEQAGDALGVAGDAAAFRMALAALGDT